MKILRGLGYIFVIILITLSLVELSLRIISRGGAVFTNFPELNPYSKLINNTLSRFSGRPKVSHPYFGYTYKRSGDSRFNSQGFLNDEFSNEESEETFKIGIFGGSFASDYAVYEKEKMKIGKSELAEVIKSVDSKKFSNKKIEIINYAIEGFKQPQLYNVATYFVDQYDLALTIDGFNIIAVPVWGDYPAYYPAFSVLFYDNNLNKQLQILAVMKLLEQRTETGNLLISLKLNNSLLVCYMWKIYWNNVNHKLSKIYERYSDDFDNGRPSPRYSSLEEELSDQINIWIRFTSLQDEFFKLNKVKHFHFIQPNQHFIGSKPLSIEERNEFIDEKRIERINKGYMMIDEHFKHLSSSKFNLTKIFSTNKATMYRDNCCHLNRDGLELFSRKIAITIRENYHP